MKTGNRHLSPAQLAAIIASAGHETRPVIARINYTGPSLRILDRQARSAAARQRAAKEAKK